MAGDQTKYPISHDCWTTDRLYMLVLFFNLSHKQNRARCDIFEIGLLSE